MLLRKKYNARLCLTAHPQRPFCVWVVVVCALAQYESSNVRSKGKGVKEKNDTMKETKRGYSALGYGSEFVFGFRVQCTHNTSFLFKGKPLQAAHVWPYIPPQILTNVRHSEEHQSGWGGYLTDEKNSYICCSRGDCLWNYCIHCTVGTGMPSMYYGKLDKTMVACHRCSCTIFPHTHGTPIAHRL